MLRSIWWAMGTSPQNGRGFSHARGTRIVTLYTIMTVVLSLSFRATADESAVSDGENAMGTRAPLTVRSVEIYVDERPDFSFLSEPELYMFCLPRGGPSGEISEWLKQETSKDLSPLSLLSSPAAINYLKRFGAVATAIEGIRETDVLYATDISLGLWPVYPSFFPAWLKSEVVTNDLGEEVVYEMKCEMWEWDAFSGNEFYGSSVIPIVAFSNGVSSITADFTSSDEPGMGPQLNARLTIECTECQQLLPANDSVSEAECASHLEATNTNCGVVIFPSAACCSSMKTFVNRYCYCVP